jgi:fructuronate reductase
VRADLTTDRDPTTIPGLLARGLRRRAAAAGPPVAFVSCDNLPGNGERLRGMVEQALVRAVGDWPPFPATMVDRIVPPPRRPRWSRARARWAWSTWPRSRPSRTPSGHRGPLRRRAPGLGRRLGGAHRRRDRLGALKLRCSTACTPTTGLPGRAGRVRHHRRDAGLPGLARLLGRLVAEDIAPTLEPPVGCGWTRTARRCCDRFANPAIEHRTIQVAMDGSQKLPQRLLHTIADRRGQGGSADSPRWRSPPGCASSAAADDGRPLPLDDPLAETIRAALPPAATPAGR